MVRTGARAAALRSLLTELGHRVAPVAPPSPRLATLPAHAGVEISSLYQAWGGTKERPLRPGSWDLALEDGLVIEPDEEFHFTRYRRQTLDLSFLVGLPWASTYRGYCERFESVAGGRRWSSPSTIAMFGGADDVGVFGEHGSPRGKQRAVYDAIKDAAAAAGDVSLARLSIHDDVGDATLETVLRGKAECDGSALLALVAARTAS